MNHKNPKKLKILVVEDETIIAINICNSLQQFGYQTEYANSGESALEIINEQKFDVVLMDIMLGEGMDGIETSKIILSKINIPIIYLTAFSDQSTLDRAQITEPSGYIIKPFHARELYITIELAIYKFESTKSFHLMQERLYESQRLESIGILSSGIAHEINNPLMGILNFAELGWEQSKEKEDSDFSHYFETILNESNKISTIVKNLINYAREDKDHLVWANVNQIVQEILSLFNQLFIKDQINLNIEYDKALPEIFCKPQKLKQAVLNIISYCRLSIHEQEQSSEKWLSIKIYLSPALKDNIRVDFMDSGKGISSQINNREKTTVGSYEKNFTLAGLGFHLSQAIVGEHGGSIKALKEDEKYLLRMELPIGSNERA
ncbi:MAG: response regulator [Leptospira sp.]|nr:response regulator [Leptospira sp.]